MQVVPQLMPAGDEVTVPVPVPARVTASAKLDELLNVAVTERAAVIETVQVLVVPVHAPLQPANVEPLAAAAVSVTFVLLATLAEHTVPQLMPPPDTVPAPVPFFATLSENVLPELLKVAVTERAWVIDTLHVVAVPLQAPLQPANVEPLAAAAVSVTDVPFE